MSNDMSCCGYKYGFICKPYRYGFHIHRESNDIYSFIANHIAEHEKLEGIELSENVGFRDIIDFNCLSGLTLEEIKSYDEEAHLLTKAPYMFFIMYDSVNYFDQTVFSDRAENERELKFVRYIGAIDISGKNMEKPINDLVANHLMKIRGKLNESNQKRANVFLEQYTSSYFSKSYML